MLIYKIDVLAALKEKGYTTYRIRQDNLIGQSSLARLKNNEPIKFEVLNTVCALLECQPGDVLEYKPD